MSQSVKYSSKDGMSFTKTKSQKRKDNATVSRKWKTAKVYFIYIMIMAGDSRASEKISWLLVTILLVSSFIQSLCFLLSDFRVFNALTVTFTKANVSLFTIENKIN